MKPCKVDFYGYKPFAAPFKRAWSATGGSSFFEWDGGNPERMIDYMRLIGFTNLVLPTAAERPHLPLFQTMPVWPAEGSVRLANGIILVKLGLEPGLGGLAPLGVRLSLTCSASPTRRLGREPRDCRTAGLR